MVAKKGLKDCDETADVKIKLRLINCLDLLCIKAIYEKISPPCYYQYCPGL